VNSNPIQASIVPDLQAECVYALVRVNSKDVRALIDTGSPITVASASLCQNLEILPYNGSFRSYTGHRLDVLGYTELQIGYRGRMCPIPAVVVRNPQFEMLLGINWIRKYVPPNHGTWDLDSIQVGEGEVSAPIVESELRTESEPTMEVEVDTVDDDELILGGGFVDPDGPHAFDIVAVVNTDEMVELQAKDPYCLAMRSRDEFVLRRGVLCKVYAVTTGPLYRIVVPAAMRETILIQAHDANMSGHLGVDKTMARIQQSYYWPGLRASVEKYVRSCSTCQHRNIAKCQLKAPLQILPTVGVFQRIYMDFVICPKSARGHTSILTVICSTSKFLVAVPMRSQSAIATATALIEHVFLVYGFPNELFSDRGTNFTSEIVRSVTYLMNVHSVFSSAYSPHSSGQVERVNQTVVDILAKIVESERVRWSDLLPYAVWAYNSSVHSSTGFSPYQVVFGLAPRDPRLDMTVFDEATPLVSVEDHVKYGFTKIRERVHQNIDIAKVRYKKNADRSVRRDQEFAVGEKVLVKNQKGTKFEDRFTGPFRILRILNPASLWVRDDVISREFSVNVDKCKRFVERADEDNVVETDSQPAIENVSPPISSQSVPAASQSPPSDRPPSVPVSPSAPQRPLMGGYFSLIQDPPNSQASLPPESTVPRKVHVDSNASRRPIDRSPYDLRPRV